MYDPAAASYTLCSDVRPSPSAFIFRNRLSRARKSRLHLDPPKEVTIRWKFLCLLIKTYVFLCAKRNIVFLQDSLHNAMK